MEDWQKLLIQENHPELVNTTTCGPTFLNILYSAKMINKEERDSLELLTKTPSVKSTELYKILPSRFKAFEKLKEALESTDQSGALRILALPEEEEAKLKSRAKEIPRDKLSFEEQPKTNVRFDVLPPVDLFTGRRTELDLLHEIILRSAKAARITVISKMTSVSGLGGIGKTQLARQYIQEKGNEFDGNVIWLNAETEVSLSECFRRLATANLGISTKDGNGIEKPIKSVVDEVYNKFKDGKALFIFDNAEKLPLLKIFLPFSVLPGSKLFLLVTSRDREWDRGMEVLDLKEFSKEDAVAFVVKGLEFEEVETEVEEEIKTLVERLQFFPLALQQAISYIHEQQLMDDYGIQDYLIEFERMQMKLLSFEDFRSLENDYTKTTLTTWKITMEKISENATHGSLAIFVLKMMSYLNPTNIKRKIFFSIATSNDDDDGEEEGNEETRRKLSEENVKYAVKLLIKYSMISGAEKQSILSIHRLVQEVTRIQIALHGPQMEEKLLEKVLRLLWGEQEVEYPTENLEHGLVAWRHAWKKHSQLVLTHSAQFDYILSKMKDRGMHQEGLAFGKEALEKVKCVFGEEAKDCFVIQRNIALILESQGKLGEALEILEMILEKSESIFGGDDNLTLAIQGDLAHVLGQMGKYEEAANLKKIIYQKKLQLLGRDHGETLTAQNNYAVSLDKCGRLDEASEIYGDLMERLKNVFGENHKNVFLTKQNYASVLYKKGDYEESIKIMKQIYEAMNLTFASTWNEDVNNFVLICHNLGSALIAAGKNEKALKILEESYGKVKQLLGDQHYRTLQISGVYGDALRRNGRDEEALNLHRERYNALRTLLGEGHNETLFARRDIALDLSLLGICNHDNHHEEAILIYREVLNKLKASTENNYEDLIETKRGLALALEREGAEENLKEALELLGEAKELIRIYCGGKEESPRFKGVVEDIARVENKITK